MLHIRSAMPPCTPGRLDCGLMWIGLSDFFHVLNTRVVPSPHIADRAAPRPDEALGSSFDAEKREIRDLEEPLSKLKPMAEEFVRPPSPPTSPAGRAPAHPPDLLPPSLPSRLQWPPPCSEEALVSNSAAKERKMRGLGGAPLQAQPHGRGARPALPHLSRRRRRPRRSSPPPSCFVPVQSGLARALLLTGDEMKTRREKEKNGRRKGMTCMARMLVSGERITTKIFWSNMNVFMWG